MFTKDIQLPITTDEPDKGNGSVRDLRPDLGQLVLGRGEYRSETIFLDDLQGRFPFEKTVAVVPIVEGLEILRLGSELTIAPEPLTAKKSAVVRVIKLFHSPIAPRFSNGNENYFDAQG